MNFGVEREKAGVDADRQGKRSFTMRIHNLRRWTIRAGDNSPIYRDEQRAFYDAVRDILLPEFGFKPVVGIYENDVRWEAVPSSSPEAATILRGIERLAGLGGKD
jgi:hypothetical protein